MGYGGNGSSSERPAQRCRTDDHPEYSLPSYRSPASGHPSASPSGLATPDANARLWRTITAILDGTIRKR
ncbi:hypothetical protein FOQG_19074 [Fusarium oxysporum f. sp. raphani 54005]|uniref:Uncharacterized protein n=1 Tax=Fusarium oxysporum f. sp. raphani 54005 TaxID=1089458 RepID=X0BBK0_FUSOX|nr:hypothetical protein FOQG_19074 [Fusarium oxysporum f. sp. raphani 54005]KAK2666688.1 hypothetical protein RAB80_017805 [Fusarium oxysporum f. sp. vasinfectum]KAK2669184.1 hypothetical protein RAB80_014710 [Fusarium oxysporum f. sp. vasinfectum]KAK2926581.1 hypothetical protein FoTM2_013450 [Fusarium oxysporum f. sp. vasinfectum]